MLDYSEAGPSSVMGAVLCMCCRSADTVHEPEGESRAPLGTTTRYGFLCCCSPAKVVIMNSQPQPVLSRVYTIQLCVWCVCMGMGKS